MKPDDFSAWFDTMIEGIVFFACEFLDRQEEALRDVKPNQRTRSRDTVTRRRRQLEEWPKKWEDEPIKKRIATLRQRQQTEVQEEF